MTGLYRFVAYFFRFLFGLLYRHRVYGLEHVTKGAAILASNHVSYFDPPLIGASWPYGLNFLARKTLFRFPIFRTIITKLHAHPIDGGVSDITTFRLISKVLQKGEQIVIFPEGERSYDGEFLPLKTGVALFALRYHCPVIPTYLHGIQKIWPRKSRFPKLWGKTACIFGSPIFPEAYAAMDKKEAQKALTDDLAERLKQLKQWYLDGAQGTPL